MVGLAAHPVYAHSGMIDRSVLLLLGHRHLTRSGLVKFELCHGHLTVFFQSCLHVKHEMLSSHV